MSGNHSYPPMGWRSLAAQTPALVISVLALAFSLGGAAYASTQLDGNGTTSNSVTFQPLTLINGWTSANGTYDTGDPSVGILKGVVYLSGSLVQSTPGGVEFAKLPSAYRPAHNLYITVYTDSDTSGTLYIGTNGDMQAYSSGACGSGSTAECYTSLASVSFPENS
jgi:hypothetical protein